MAIRTMTIGEIEFRVLIDETDDGVEGMQLDVRPKTGDGIYLGLEEWQELKDWIDSEFARFDAILKSCPAPIPQSEKVQP